MSTEENKKTQKNESDENPTDEGNAESKLESKAGNSNRHVKDQGNIYDARNRLGKSLDASRQKHESKEHQDEDKSEVDDKSSQNTVDASIKNAKNSNVNIAGGDIYNGATPEQIGTIFDTFLRKILKINDEKSSKVSQKKRPKNLEDCFNELDLYDKYYFITLSFFEGISITEFDHIFEIIRDLLFDELYEQKEQINRLYMSLPTIPGLEVIEHFDADRSARVYKFKQPDGGQTLLNFVKERHSKLLYKFVTAIKKVVEQYPHTPEIRVLAAYALGEIARLDVDYVYESAIKPFADSKHDGIRATVGYFFAYLFVSPVQDGINLKKYLRNTLTQWTNSGNWHYKWSAASVCEQLGLFAEDAHDQTLAREALEKLAGTDDIRVANAVIHALVGWSLKKEFVVSLELINKWAEQGSAGRNDQFNPHQVRCIVGIWAFWAIVIRNSELLIKKITHESIHPLDIAETILKSRKTPKDLLPMITTVAIRSFEFQMGNYFFEGLEKWVGITQNNKEVQTLVPIWLRRIYANLPENSLHRRHMENRIANIWLKSKNSQMLAIAKAMQSNT
jgi:hypothetical protein